MRCLVLRCLNDCALSSDFLVLETVNEEEESRAGVGLIDVVGIAESSIHVVAGSAEDLDLIELGIDFLAHGGGTLHEGLNSLLSAGGLEVSLDLGEVSLDVGSPRCLLELHFFKLECIDNINDVGDIISTSSAFVFIISYKKGRLDAAIDNAIKEAQNAPYSKLDTYH
jgi:hypothetical protein